MTESQRAASLDRTESTVGPLAASVVLGLGTLISHGFGLALVPAMLPRIADDLGIGYGALGAAVATGLVAYSIGALSTGWILDRVPNRAALIGTYAISLIGLLLAGAANSTATLTVAVMILGFVAPLSWALTLHIAGATTEPGSRAAVMATASGGAALGVLINGVLVQTSDSIHTWRISFVIAASIAAVPIALGGVVYRRPIPRPSAEPGVVRGAFRTAFATRTGRVVVFAGLVAGIAGFPFNVFLTATALDEMGVSALSAGSVWWLIGILGLLAGPILGRYGDRTSPLLSLAVGAALYWAGLVVLIVSWSYLGLLIAAVGYAFMNYPIWGLVGALANRRFPPGLAVRAVSLGLVLASLGGAVGNALAGPWIETRGSFRGPVVAMASIVAGLLVWYVAIIRSAGLSRDGRESGQPPAGSIG